jgi:hypothetical protein
VATVEDGNVLRATRNSVTGGKAMSTVSRLITLAATLLCAALFAVPAAATVSVPITFRYTGTFEFTPANPSPCDGVPITDTVTGTGSHLGQLTASYRTA